MNTKATPKSCSCANCRYGKAKGWGNYRMKHEERAFRHEAKATLKRADDLELVMLSAAPHGAYND